MVKEHSLKCPECDKTSPFIGDLKDNNYTEIFFCYNCKHFFGIPDNGDLYIWVGDRGVEANFNEIEEDD